MKSLTPFLPAGLLALTVAFPVAAQETTAPAAPMTTEAPAAMAPACDERFALLDTNGDGYLSEDEAPSVYARSRIDGFAIGTEGYPLNDYLADCDNALFDRPVPEEGAPFEGANSFTEEQARDRAVAWGYGEVSNLVQDEQGIWRGTAHDGETQVSVAIDYKGNVVATAAQ